MKKPHCIILFGNHSLPTTKYAGTFRIATELRIHGYDVQCIDITAFNGLDENLYKILDEIVSDKTLWVGFSTTFLYHIMGYPFFRTKQGKSHRLTNNPNIDQYLNDFITFIKNKNPNVHLIAGGSRTFMIEDYGFKIFSFYNDTEIIDFTKWCQTKSKKNAEFESSHIQGSEFKNFHNSQIIFDKSDIISKNDTLPIEISRGCIFKCKFCSFPMNGKTKGEWVKNTNILRDELNKNYEAHGVSDYIFSDDTYNDSEIKVKTLYDDVFSKLSFKINFTTYLRLDLMIRFPDTVEYLKESGLISALFGIETINKESGVAIGKGLDPKIQFDFIKEIKQTHFKNIMTHSGFIIGLPNDRIDETEHLENWLFSNDNYLDHVQVDPLILSPNGKEFSGHRKFFSAFDREYEKYGYECYTDYNGSAKTEIKWKNTKNNMTFDKAWLWAEKINNKILFQSDKFKFGGFAFPYYKSLGVDQNDLFNLSKRQIARKYNLTQLTEKKKQQYRILLLNQIFNS